jgi:hypothetical protein
MGAMDGITFLTSVRGEDPRAAYRALKAVLLSYAVVGALVAGREPPLAKLADLVARPG